MFEQDNSQKKEGDCTPEGFQIQDPVVAPLILCP